MIRWAEKELSKNVKKKKKKRQMIEIISYKLKHLMTQQLFF